MIKTKFTELFGLDVPLALAPMTPAAGGALAAAVSRAGGLGLLGGGYGDRAWLEREFAVARAQPGGDRVGCGFITWSMARSPEILDLALAQRPVAMMLSFADPAPFAATIQAAGVPMICQVHTLEHARRALDSGMAVLVAQGTEAGGHGLRTRGTMAFVPAVADLLSRENAKVALLAAGGIADGRGVAAALMLGADGALLGTRFWATRESLIHASAKEKVVRATGDDTLRTRVYDIARGRDWPAGYDARLLRNAFIEKWHGHEDDLAALRTTELANIEDADASGDYDIANVTVGEAAGLVNDLPSAADLVRRIADEARERLRRVAASAAG